MSIIGDLIFFGSMVVGLVALVGLAYLATLVAREFAARSEAEAEHYERLRHPTHVRVRPAPYDWDKERGGLRP